MRKYDLNGIWNLTGAGFNANGKIPGSVYSILLENNLMENPYFRDNENKAFELMDNEFTFTRTFDCPELSSKNTLVLEGVDTLCDFYVNGEFVGHTENMHRTYRFNVSKLLKESGNEIKAVFPSADKFIKEEQAKRFVAGVYDQTAYGYPHLRKAHCMFGWDWGPMLPDAGIWRNIYILDETVPYIKDIRVIQRHEEEVYITCTAETSKKANLTLTLTSPNGKTFTLENGVEFKVENPELWWPNGLGAQPLYTVTATLDVKGEKVDEMQKKIGLRTLILSRAKDEIGEECTFIANGVKFFAMGADYVPEDNILSRITPERSEKLIKNCVDCHFNCIRIWGGGYYPEDWFFDLCDKYGIVLFLDMMFACSDYPYGKAFTTNVLAEITDNALRFRNHACIGVISGNNENEDAYCNHWEGFDGEDRRKGYLKLFEKDIPELLKTLCPEISYIPSSPTSYGGFKDTANENLGDNHYWEVWSNDKPFTDYRKHVFRFLSEFGFQSFPEEKTVNSYTYPEDRNIFTRIMEKHQRQHVANGRILNYIAQNYLYPTNLPALLYASQLNQAEAIKYCVEHLRRNRGRCMGTLYWQLNDIWPTASWASIDYYGRYKALQYYSKRFYTPVIISAEETNEFDNRKSVNFERIYKYESKARLVVTSDSLQEFNGQVIWQLKDSFGCTVKEDKIDVSINPQSVKEICNLDFTGIDVNEYHLYYAVIKEGEIISDGNVLFTKPKFYNFKKPKFKVKIKNGYVTIKSNVYAKSVELYSMDSDFILSDNFFDLNGNEKTVKVLDGQVKKLKVRSVYDIR